MAKQKMTIHRALSELKLIDSKIDKGIHDLDPMGLQQEGKLVNNRYPLDEFNTRVTGKYQSITDLIERKINIKQAIMFSNSVTMVKIGDKVMKVTDAIAFKDIVTMKERVANRMLMKSKTVVNKFNTENERVEAKALENAKIMVGKDNTKVSDKEVKDLMEPFIKRNSYKLIDPLDVTNILDALTKEIEEFKSEVDAILSESNALTFIEID